MLFLERKIEFRYIRIAIFLFCSLVILLLGGCAPMKWEMVGADKREIAWPPPSHPQKISYIRELTGFQQAGQTMSSLLFGRKISGKIIKPVAIAVGPKGQMAIADQGRKGIHLFYQDSQRYLFLLTAGNEIIKSPAGLAFDDEGALFITDSLSRKIYVFDNDGAFRMSITMAGDEPLLRPTGIVFNRVDKRLYVADTKRHQLLIYNRLGGFVGRIGSRGTAAGSFNFPTHLATDRSGNIYVTDSMNFRAQIFSLELNTWKTFGRHGNGTGDFASPKGIGVDSNGVIYIAETLFDTVQLFNSYGIYLLGLGSQGNDPGQFYMPSALFVDDSDKLYVCDTYNQRIQMFQLITDGLP
jgi:DNA-binding beta-propeller fold protein YncE